MKCPVDNTTLVMTERAGVEIDYCPDCRGVWLDRGELDKIVQGAAREQRTNSSDNYEHGHEDDSRRYESRDRGHEDKGRNKRGSFLGDIFGGFGE